MFFHRWIFGLLFWTIAQSTCCTWTSAVSTSPQHNVSTLEHLTLDLYQLHDNEQTLEGWAMSWMCLQSSDLRTKEILKRAFNRDATLSSLFLFTFSAEGKWKINPWVILTPFSSVWFISLNEHSVRLFTVCTRRMWQMLRHEQRLKISALWLNKPANIKKPYPHWNTFTSTFIRSLKKPECSHWEGFLLPKRISLFLMDVGKKLLLLY